MKMNCNFLLFTVSLALLSFCVKSENLFKQHDMYVNRGFVSDVNNTMRISKPSDKHLLRGLLNVPVATWLDTIQKVNSRSPTKDSLIDVLNDAVKMSPVPVATFVVYNLPNRDCSARASAGKICCIPKSANGTCDYAAAEDCTFGLKRYIKHYINPIAGKARAFCGKVPMVFIIEPDSLPNLVTNLENPRCGSKGTEMGYLNGIRMAVRRIHRACSSASIYVDAAHGAWLGWDSGATGYAALVKKMDIARFIRGFVTNVSGYQHLGVTCPSLGYCNGGENPGHPCCKEDPCGLTGDFNPGFTELNYIRQVLDKTTAAIPGFDPHFLIDTSRNGVPAARKSCSNWCNIRNAGLGLRPTSNTESPKLVDAYVWVKVPGETDGCTKKLPGGRKCKRFDEACASEDSIGSMKGEPRVPEAGTWFEYQIKGLVRRGLM